MHAGLSLGLHNAIILANKIPIKIILQNGLVRWTLLSRSTEHSILFTDFSIRNVLPCKFKTIILSDCTPSQILNPIISTNPVYVVNTRLTFRIRNKSISNKPMDRVVRFSAKCITKNHPRIPLVYPRRQYSLSKDKQTHLMPMDFTMQPFNSTEATYFIQPLITNNRLPNLILHNQKQAPNFREAVAAPRYSSGVLNFLSLSATQCYANIQIINKLSK